MLALLVLLSHDTFVLQSHRHGAVLAFVPLTSTARNVRRSSFVPEPRGDGGGSSAGGGIVQPVLERPNNVGGSVPFPSWGTATKRDSTKLHMFRRLFRRLRNDEETGDDNTGGSEDAGNGRKDDDDDDQASKDDLPVSQTATNVPYFVNMKGDDTTDDGKDTNEDDTNEPAEAEITTSQITADNPDQPTAPPSLPTETTPTSSITPETIEVGSGVVEEVPSVSPSQNTDTVEQTETPSSFTAEIVTPSSISTETESSSTADIETPSSISTEAQSSSTTEIETPSSVSTETDSSSNAEIETPSSASTETPSSSTVEIETPPPVSTDTPPSSTTDVIEEESTDTDMIEQPTEPSSSTTITPPSASTETEPSSTMTPSQSDDDDVATGGDNKDDDPEESDEIEAEAEPPKVDNSTPETTTPAAPEQPPSVSTEPSTVTPTATVTPPSEPQTPLERAQALLAQAKRVRLEAERMDVVLTLDKISKIEVELGGPKALEDEERRGVLKGQMRDLKKKLGGGDDDEDDGAGTGSGGQGVDAAPSGSGGTATSSVPKESRAQSTESRELSADDLQARVEAFEKVPEFMRKAVAGAVGIDPEGINSTELVLKIYEDEVRDLDATAMNEDQGTDDAPKFTQQEIDETVQQLQDVPGFFKNIFVDGEKNDTEVAVTILTNNLSKPISQSEIDEKLEQMSWIPSFMRGNNETKLAIDLIEMGRYMDDVEERELGKKSPSSVEGGAENEASNSTIIPAFDFLYNKFGPEIGTPTDNLIEGCFPKECRREGEEPTEAQAKIVLEDVLAKNNTWNILGEPEKVPGGFIIRGSTDYENGSALVEALDANMASSRIRDSASLFYVYDPTPVTEEQADLGTRPPVLFLLGPQVVDDPTPLRSGLLSVVGVVTLWSSAIYPFLLNDKYMKLVEEQIAFSDASMPSNIDFINEMAYPLFAASLSIYFAHEVAHKVVADANGMNITFPTLVPSFLTGITGTITSLAAPPKNKQDLLDFAIVGPLAGMTVSTLLLYVGITITASTGAEAYANLPSLSLSVLRQSSLAGGIMEAVIPGILNIPDAAGATRALSEVSIPLHPLAIAGFFGLMVNAVNLLPLGRTDGGRVGLALFGRTGLQVAGFITSVGLLIQGLFGSDLLLFFFSYVVFFQGDMEIPQRNEVDDIDFSRVLLATAAGVLVLLTLIPM